MCIRKLVVGTNVELMESSDTVSLGATVAGFWQLYTGRENRELEASGRLQGDA